MVSFDPSERDRMMKVNVEGTANVVNACLSAGVKKLLYVSSVASLGMVNDESVIDENTEWNEDDDNPNYAVSKFLGEVEVWRGMAEGLNAVIINPSLILGAGKWTDTSLKIFKTVAEGQAFYPLGGNGYVDVRDVAKIMIELMEGDISGERFIVNAENLSYKEVIDSIADKMGVKKPTIPVKGLITLVGRAYDAVKSKLTGSMPVFSAEVARYTQMNFRYDSNKFRGLKEYEYIPISRSISDGVRAYQESLELKRDYAILDLH
jgi:nucleoside-diphosphate-sugar epimerase